MVLITTLPRRGAGFFLGRLPLRPTASHLQGSNESPYSATLPRTPPNSFFFGHDNHNRYYASGVGAPKSRTELLHVERQRLHSLNAGRAVDVLREEIPTLLSEAPSLDIFSPDVRLTDEAGKAIVTGRQAYAALFAGLRLARRLTLSGPPPLLEVLSLAYRERAGEIVVRFGVEGEASPAALMLGLGFGGGGVWGGVWGGGGGGNPLGLRGFGDGGGDCVLRFDGVSVYTLDAHGLIAEHQVDNKTRRHLLNPVVPALRSFSGASSLRPHLNHN